MALNNVDNGFEQTTTGGDNALFLDGALVSTKINYAISPGASDIVEIAITMQDGHGTAIAEPFLINVWLSDDAAGVDITGTTASGTVQPKTSSGVIFQTITAKKVLSVQALATGIFTLEITDTNTTGFFIVTQIPTSGAVSVSRQLIAGDYGT